MNRISSSLVGSLAERGALSAWGESFADAYFVAARGGFDSGPAASPAAATGRCGCPACTGGSEALAAPAAPSQVPTDSIDWGSTVDSNRVTVYFVPEGEKVGGSTSKGWSAYEQDQAMAALDTYAQVSNLTFSVTNNPDNATFKLVTVKSFFYLGSFSPPGESNEGVGKFAINGTGWDDAGGLEQGGYGFITMIHEFGHGLGMAHPHDNGGGSPIMRGVSSSFDDYGDFDLNQGIYTTMSYNDGWQLHPDAVGGFPPGSPNDYGYQAGPMALDIAVIQDKYGANMDYRTGNDSYVLPDANEAGTFWTCIWDAGGIDTIVHDGSKSATIDLTAATLDYSPTGGGMISWADGIFGGYTIANGVVIENAKGGRAGDLITGNDAANFLKGRNGADVLTGGGGKDALNGGDGADQFVFNSLDKADADTIADFRDNDTIALDGDVYGLTPGVLGGGRFVIGEEAGDTNDRLIYNDRTGQLFFDADGSGNGDQVLIATLENSPSLAAADIIVV